MAAHAGLVTSCNIPQLKKPVLVLPVHLMQGRIDREQIDRSRIFQISAC